MMPTTYRSRSIRFADDPDIMNDPAFDNKHKGAGDNADEPDTCRICRGEATKEEPLFYPCKCSGSIKFVHQECLMEWLSHSQKKHCELCKTPFRFTKLYDPQMPKVLPTTVIIRSAILHAISLFLLWCRAVLCGTVWLLWLPWCMRFVWRSLFWVADAGWTANSSATTFAQSAQSTLLQGQDNGTLSPNHTALDAARASSSSTSAYPGGIMQMFSRSLNQSRSEPMALALIKDIFFPVRHSHTSAINGSTVEPMTNSTSSHVPHHSYRSSLLSEMPLFSNLSPYPGLNRLIVDVLEGQIISLSVVVTCILVFLIREWVVQQQPAINLAALHAENNGVRAAAAQAGEQAVRNDERAAPEENAVDTGSNTELPNGTDSGPEVPTQELGTDRPRLLPTSGAREQENHAPAEELPTNIPRLVFRGQPPVFPLHVRDAMDHGDYEKAIQLIEKLPDYERDAWLYRIRRMSRFVRDPGSAGSEPFAIDDAELPEPDARLPIHTEAEGSSARIKDKDRESGRLGEGSSSQQRPGMPAKERSFLATAIHRSLEEDTRPREHLNHFGRKPRRQVDDDRGSPAVDGSWQMPSDLDSPDQSQSLSTSRSQHTAKGKGKISNDGEDANVYNATALHDEDSNIQDWADSTSTPESRTSHVSAAEARKENDDSSAENLPSDSPVSSEDHPIHQHGEIGPDESTRPSSSHRDNGAVGTVEHGNLEDQEVPSGRTEERLEQKLKWYDHVLGWFWGDVVPADPPEPESDNEEQMVNGFADEDPFAELDAEEGADGDIDVDEDVQQDQDAAEQAEMDLNDQEAVEDAEDLEGILELVGMQGPMIGLFQNVIFGAVLISATVTGAVWLPYLWGKVVLLFLDSPLSFLGMPIQLITVLSDFVADLCLLVAGTIVFWVLKAVQTGLALAAMVFPSIAPSDFLAAYLGPIRHVSSSAMNRLTGLIGGSVTGVDSDWLYLTLNAHSALKSIEQSVSKLFLLTKDTAIALYRGASSMNYRSFVQQLGPQLVKTLYQSCVHVSKGANFLWHSLTHPGTLTVTLKPIHRLNSPADAKIIQWSPWDRLFAVLAGYALFAVVGALYLKRGRPFSRSSRGKKIERLIAELLRQAGGILKVILIISIEMILFPLYCGVLLDLALLPLFGTATIWTRLAFATKSPWIAGFVHWFIGTCYMFHFALFVSMCRKIMRKGVLYFIRDPDDPTFHPVRDVLERNVTTQLRKITFSAIVYGALVMLCLGGVVWALYFSGLGILPLQWSSTEPLVEFSVDLLLYYFITPLVIKYAKPSDGLHAMYKWWFHTCARALRLSHFLFGERRSDEEGYHIRRTWASWITRSKGNVDEPVIGEDRRILAEDRGQDVYFMWDGRLVRAPASDQVRIPKGAPVFVEVDHLNKRVDDGPEDEGIHASDSEKMTVVYIPPWFRTRISLFVFTIWLFAAATGVGLTIVPLVFGRQFLSYLSPGSRPINDIYAFSMGVYTLGGLLYGAMRLRNFVSIAYSRLSPSSVRVSNVFFTAKNFIMQVIALVYVYSLLTIVLPVLLALILEFYFLVPLHTYFSPESPHTIHLVQDWTLGFLYGRIAALALFSNRAGRPARVLQAVIRDGYLRPNPRLATRCFILPISLFLLFALLVPYGVARALNATLFASASNASKILVHRMMYPGVLFVGGAVWTGGALARETHRWTQRVRDEVYLIGERLHNFGEKKARQPIGQADKNEWKEVQRLAVQDAGNA